MKRLFVLAAILLIALPANAQTNTFPSSGNAGIGTTSPQSQLDVVTSSTPATRGIASYQYGSGNLAALLTLYRAGGTPSSPTAVTTGGYGSGINMDAYDGSNFLDTAGVSSHINGTISTGSVPQDLILWTTGGANDNDPYANGHVRMVITSGGNVGIGTTAPTSLLHTVDSSAQTATYIGVEHAVSATSSTASVNKTGVDVESTGTWNGTGAVNIGLNVNATGATTNYAALFNGGSVGIGTTSPANPLTVNGIIQSLTGGLKFPDGTTQTTAATPSPSPGMVLLATVNASGASSVSFGSSYITSTYNKYVVEFDGLFGSSNGAALYLTISTNNGSSYLSSNYFYAGTYSELAVNSPSVSGFGGGQFGDSQFILSNNGLSGLSTTSTIPAQGRIELSSPSAAKRLNITWDMVAPGNSFPSSITGGGYNSGTTAINAIQFTVSSGTLTGNFHLYGLSGT